LRWAGFLPLNFMRSTKLSATTKLSAEHETPPIANVLLAAGVPLHCVCKPLSLLSFRSFVCRVVRCVFYFFFEGSENFLKPFLSALALQALLQTLACVSACAVCKCACKMRGLKKQSSHLLYSSAMFRLGSLSNRQ